MTEEKKNEDGLFIRFKKGDLEASVKLPAENGEEIARNIMTVATSAKKEEQAEEKKEESSGEESQSEE